MPVKAKKTAKPAQIARHTQALRKAVKNAAEYRVGPKRYPRVTARTTARSTARSSRR
jgi:hypothetical protein